MDGFGRSLATAGALLLAVASGAPCANELPPEACDTSAAVFASSFDPAPQLGSYSLELQVPGIGPRSFRIHAPTTLQPPRRAALLVTLHGAAGPGNAPAAAEFMRDAWSSESEAAAFVVLAPVASGSQGGWLPSQDYPALAEAIAEMQSRYPIDARRLYLHGFSAGGHVSHDLGLYNSDYFAAYAAQAGVLAALAGDAAPALAAGVRRIPAMARVGLSDSLLDFAQDDRLEFLAAGWSEPDDYRLDTFAGGHVFDATHVPAAWTFLCRRALPATP